MGLQVSELSVTAQATVLVSAATFTLNPGELVVIVGPNGAGKTSLLRGTLGLAPHQTGQVTLDGVDFFTLSSSARARNIAYLPQMRRLAWPNRVRDIVALGRFAHGSALGRLSPDDAAAVDRALTACDLAQLADRTVDTLSGGEQARMHFARALAAETPYLIADEPVSSLDPRQQLRVMDLVKTYVDAGGGALLILHDLQLAAQYADRLIWMQSGRIQAQGSVSESLNAERLELIFGIKARLRDRQIEVLGPA